MLRDTQLAGRLFVQSMIQAMANERRNMQVIRKGR